MPGARLPMRKIRDVLRLRAGGMSKRKIAASLSIGVTAAGDCVRRARRAGLSWPLPEELSDEALERLLYAANRRAMIEGFIDADPVAACVRDMMASRNQWTGTASDFLLAADKLQRQEASIRRPDWPRTPRALAGRLRRAQTDRFASTIASAASTPRRSDLTIDLAAGGTDGRHTPDCEGPWLLAWGFSLSP
jgi:hypothetical protein